MAAFVAIVCFCCGWLLFKIKEMRNILYYLAKSAVIIAIAVILYYIYTTFFV